MPEPPEFRHFLQFSDKIDRFSDKIDNIKLNIEHFSSEK
jgi:hypothetical protein